MDAMPAHKDQRQAIKHPALPDCDCSDTVQHNDMLQVVIPAKRGRGYTLVTEYTIECAACGYTLYVVKGDHWPARSSTQ